MRLMFGAGRRVLHLEVHRGGVEWSLGHWAEDVEGEDGDGQSLSADTERDDRGDRFDVGFRGGVVV